MRTGLGFGLWVSGDEADDKAPVEDLNSHSLWAIKERMQQSYTKALMKGMSVSDIAKAVQKTEDEVRVLFTFFDQLHRFEQELNSL